MKKKTPSETEFSSGEKLLYNGKGFIGFDPRDRSCTFLSYENVFDAFVKFDYIDHPVLVFRYEIEKLSTRSIP